MPPEQPAPEAMVPVWAVTLTAQVAEIKAKTDVIPDLARELEGLKASMVPVSEHQRLLVQVGTLWDNYNTQQGEMKQRARSENLWRIGFTLALGLLGLWIAAKQAGIHIVI